MTQQVTSSTLTRVFKQMKAEDPERLLIFAIGDFYISFADDAKTLSEVLGITLTRTSAKDITAQQAAFPSYELCEQLDKLLRVVKRIAIN